MEPFFLNLVVFILINISSLTVLSETSINTGKYTQHLWRNKRNKNSTELYASSSTSCNIDLLQCKEDEICKVIDSRSKIGVCLCKGGWRRKKDGTSNCEKILKLKKKQCEMGLLQCLENEKCVSINNRSRNGFCECNFYNSDGSCFQKTNPTVVTAAAIDLTTVTNLSEGEDRITDGYTLYHNSTLSYLENSKISTRPISVITSPSPFEIDLITKKQVIKKIIVKISNKTITLPEGVTHSKQWTTLSAYAIGGSDANYQFIWNVLSKPDSKEEGSISDTKTQTISLKNLIEGVYIFNVSVSSTNGYGETTGNITVIPAKHTNTPPEAVIVPSSQTVKLPNSVVIFDASGSKDDVQVVSFQWELILGPIGYKLKESTGPTLQMTDPVPGNYTVMLKVIDNEGLEGNATASLIIVKETDYPPTANAGGDKIIYLPESKITLNGSSSSDDHGITEWEWTKGPEDSGNPVDMQDTRTPLLRLSNLEPGHYHFILKVIDTAQQSANSTAHVYVHSSKDNIIEANAGVNRSIIVPDDWVTLDGSSSKGISSLSHYLWKQLIGPKIANLKPINEVKINATGLTRGVFVFQMTIWNDDSNKNSSSNVTISVIQETNAAPIARAGGDFSVILPVSVVLVNGSSSTDDVGIVKWRWQRDDASLAAATVIKRSDHSPVLLFTDVVPGRYVWNLTVKDDQGSSSTDSVSIIVKEGVHHMDQVDILLGVGIEHLSVSQLNNLIQKLQLLLQSTSTDVSFNVQNIVGRPLAGTVSLIVLGYRKDKVIPGTSLVQQLRSKTMLNSKARIIDLPIMSINTVVCQNDCSGHGECIQSTRECRCHSWWMGSSFRRRFGDGLPNCDWSVIYVFVGAIGSSLLTGACLWMIAALLVNNVKKLKRRKPKSPKYSLLEGSDDVNLKVRIPGSLLDSGSDTDSESEVLFDSRKRIKSDKLVKNGHVKLQRIRT